MGRGHTPYGYRIENGMAVIDENEAAQVRQLCEGYLKGLGLKDAAKEAGLDLYHGSAIRMMLNRHYTGDEFYPQILDVETQAEVEAERQKRSRGLGRDDKPSRHKPAALPATKFRMENSERCIADPYEEAEYLYDLIGKEN